MRRLGYVVAFVVVLIVALAIGFGGGRFLIQRLKSDLAPNTSWTPPTPSVTDAAQSDAAQIRPTAPLVAVTPTSAPTRVVVEVPAPATSEPVATEAPTSTATQVRSDESKPPLTVAPTPTETAAATRDVPPTETPSVSPFPFAVLGGVRNTSGDCPGSYVLGQVTDRAGAPLPGVQLLLVDEFGNQDVKTSKSGADAGRYDFPLFPPPRIFYLSVVDEGGRPLSPRIEVAHGVGAHPMATCHWADWRQR